MWENRGESFYQRKYLQIIHLIKGLDLEYTKKKKKKTYNSVKAQITQFKNQQSVCNRHFSKDVQMARTCTRRASAPWTITARRSTPPLIYEEKQAYNVLGRMWRPLTHAARVEMVQLPSKAAWQLLSMLAKVTIWPWNFTPRYTLRVNKNLCP